MYLDCKPFGAETCLFHVTQSPVYLDGPFVTNNNEQFLHNREPKKPKAFKVNSANVIFNPAKVSGRVGQFHLRWMQLTTQSSAVVTPTEFNEADSQECAHGIQ